MCIVPRIGATLIFSVWLLSFAWSEARGERFNEQATCTPIHSRALQNEISLFEHSQYTYGELLPLRNIQAEYQRVFQPQFSRQWDEERQWSQWNPSTLAWQEHYRNYMAKRSLVDQVPAEERDFRTYYAPLLVPCNIDDTPFYIPRYAAISHPVNIVRRLQEAFPNCNIPDDIDLPPGQSYAEVSEDIRRWEASYRRENFVTGHFFDYFTGGINLSPQAETQIDIYEREEVLQEAGDQLVGFLGARGCLSENELRGLENGTDMICVPVDIPATTQDNHRKVSRLQRLFYDIEAQQPSCLLNVEYHDFIRVQLPRHFEVCYKRSHEDYADWHRRFVLSAILSETELKNYCLPPLDGEKTDTTLSEFCIPTDIKIGFCDLGSAGVSYEYPLTLSITEIRREGKLLPKQGVIEQGFLREDVLPSKINLTLCGNTIFGTGFLQAEDLSCQPYPFLDYAIEKTKNVIADLQVRVEDVRQVRRDRNREIRALATQRLMQKYIPVMPEGKAEMLRTSPFRSSVYRPSDEQDVSMLRQFKLDSFPRYCFKNADSFLQQPMELYEECVSLNIDTWAFNKFVKGNYFDLRRKDAEKLVLEQSWGWKSLIDIPVRQIADILDFDFNTTYQYAYAYLPLEQQAVAIKMFHDVFYGDPTIVKNMEEDDRKQAGQLIATRGYAYQRQWVGVNISSYPSERLRQWRENISPIHSSMIKTYVAAHIYSRRELWAHMYGTRLLPTQVIMSGRMAYEYGVCGDAHFVPLADEAVFRSTGRFFQILNGAQDVTMQRVFETFDEQRGFFPALFTQMGTSDDEMFYGAREMGFDNFDRVRTWDQGIEEVEAGNPVMTGYLWAGASMQPEYLFPRYSERYAITDNIFVAHYSIITAVEKDEAGNPRALRLQNYNQIDWVDYDVFQRSWQTYDNFFWGRVIGLENYSFLFRLPR